MMDLPDFMSNMQEGMSRMVTNAQTAYQDAQTAYQDMMRGLYAPTLRQYDETMRGPSRGTYDHRHGHHHHGHGCSCGCHDTCECHCECCVCDADVLVHARCGEVRRIPVTFSNDSRRERQVKLDLEKFVTKGGRDVNWTATLSETEFTLKPCGEHTVTLTVGVRCDSFTGGGTDNQPGTPGTNPNQPNPSATSDGAPTINRGPVGTVDRCEVAYAVLRAEGCSVRPAVIAVAVLPDNCDAYRRRCGCDCCH
jgi:hypothetical protein